MKYRPRAHSVAAPLKWVTKLAVAGAFLAAPVFACSSAAIEAPAVDAGADTLLEDGPIVQDVKAPPAPTEASAPDIGVPDSAAVSYTHLTLPTSDLV